MAVRQSVMGLATWLFLAWGVMSCSTMEGLGKDLQNLDTVLRSKVKPEATYSKVEPETTYFENLERGKRQYLEGNFSAAIVSLKKAIREMNTTPKTGKRQLIDAHLHLGLCYRAKGQLDLAKQEFKTVLRLDTAYRLSPMDYSGDVIGLFEEARREMRDNL